MGIVGFLITCIRKSPPSRYTKVFLLPTFALQNEYKLIIKIYKRNLYDIFSLVNLSQTFARL